MTIGQVGRRADGRGPHDLRPVRLELGVLKWAEGSCRIRVGDTDVLCAATIEDRIPPHLRGTGTGWVTAEYSMLPRATAERSQRESAKGRIGGRTHEIQRLVGRSLRGVVDLARLGERTVTVDCDVIQADGGTRTASITGGYVALAAALTTYGMERLLLHKVAAVSVGIVGGVQMLDLDYPEDSKAEVDFNVVGTDAGTYVELQGTAEGKPFDRPGVDALLDLANEGLTRLFAIQGEALAKLPPVTGRRVVVATHSAHKLGELRELLGASDLDVELVSLGELGITADVPEDARTFEGNAAAKARTVARMTGLPTLADDSGLEVDALDGRPGVRTRRYAGEHATDTENNAKLLAALGGLPPERRRARYVCVLALAEPTAAGAIAITTRRGTCRGRIAVAPKGRNGFGYDPIFEPAVEPPGGRTLGEWSAEEKNAISHRAKAARRMSRVLRDRSD